MRSNPCLRTMQARLTGHFTKQVIMHRQTTASVLRSVYIKVGSQVLSLNEHHSIKADMGPRDRVLAVIRVTFRC